MPQNKCFIKWTTCLSVWVNVRVCTEYSKNGNWNRRVLLYLGIYNYGHSRYLFYAAILYKETNGLVPSFDCTSRNNRTEWMKWKRGNSRTQVNGESLQEESLLHPFNTSTVIIRKWGSQNKHCSIRYKILLVKRGIKKPLLPRVGEDRPIWKGGTGKIGQ